MELQWPLILFTTFIAWSAGLFAVQGIYALKDESAKAQMPALIVSFVLMVVGGIAVFFHLQHWERIFNGFGHITSGITQELIAIVVLFVVMVLYFSYLRRNDDKVPGWVAWLAIVFSAVLVVVMAHSYMMPSRPAWDSVLEILSLLGGAAAMGAGTFAFIESLREDAPSPRTAGCAVIGTAANVATTVIYLIGMVATAGSAFVAVGMYFDPTHPNKALADAAAYSPLAAASLPLTITAIVAAVLALVCALVAKKKGGWKTAGAAIAVAAVVCTIVLRVVFYQCGGSVFMYY